MRGAAAVVGVADVASPTGELDLYGRALEVGDGARRRSPTPGSRSPTSTACATRCRRCCFAEYLGIHPALHRQHDDRRLELRGAPRARGGRDRRRAVRRGRRRLRRPRPRSDRKRGVERDRGRRWLGPEPGARVGDAVRAAPADGAVRAGREPAHGGVRHHLGAARADRGEHPPVGGDEPAGALPGSDHGRRRRSRRRSSARRCTGSTAASSPTARARS